MSSDDRYRMGQAQAKEHMLSSLITSDGYKLLRNIMQDRYMKIVQRQQREEDPREWDRLAGEARAYRAFIGDPGEMDSIAAKEILAAHQELNRLGAGLR